MNSRLRNSILVVLLPAMMVMNVLSQGTIYTSRSVFEGALGSSTSITFEDLPPSHDPSGLGVPGMTTSGVTFTNRGANLLITDPNGQPYPIPGTGQYLWNFDGSRPVRILLPAEVTAFGADLSGGIDPPPTYDATLTFNLASGGTYVYTFSRPRGSWVFVGATFGQPIASVIFDGGGASSPGLHNEMLDNVTFGSAIPEPSAVCFFALGGALLSWRFLRQRA